MDHKSYIAGNTATMQTAANTTNKKPTSRQRTIDHMSDDRKEGEKWRVVNLGEMGVFEGECKEGVPHGRGTLRLKNGDCFQGEFIDGVFNGKGKIFGGDGNEYEGGWVGGKREGQGVERWKEGGKYEGGFEKDEKSGYGRPG